MSEELLIRYCSPTLAGLKTGSLVSCPYETREGSLREIRALNRELLSKGLCVLPLRYAATRVLIYMYRPSRLRLDLSAPGAAALLSEAGYDSPRPERCLPELIRRLNRGDAFPHEIGLFLSYPPEDVRGFIENHAANCKRVGFWKVYGDEREAARTFDMYKKCTDVYCRQWELGKSMAQLAVPM